MLYAWENRTLNTAHEEVKWTTHYTSPIDTTLARISCTSRACTYSEFDIIWFLILSEGCTEISQIIALVTVYKNIALVSCGVYCVVENGIEHHRLCPEKFRKLSSLSQLRDFHTPYNDMRSTVDHASCACQAGVCCRSSVNNWHIYSTDYHRR